MKKTLLLMVSLLMGVNGTWADPELTAVTTETTWDFASLSFTSGSEEAQFLQDNTIYIGAGITKNARAVFNGVNSDYPNVLGSNIIAFKAGVNGQVFIKVSSYNGKVKITDGTNELKSYGRSEHDGGLSYLRHSFNVTSGTTYFIYASSIGENTGVISLHFFPCANTTEPLSMTENFTWDFTPTSDRETIDFNGITWNNLYQGAGVKHYVGNNTKGVDVTRLAFTGNCATDPSSETTDQTICFKIPAYSKGRLTFKLSCYSNNIKVKYGEVVTTYEKGNTYHNTEQSIDIDNSASSDAMNVWFYSSECTEFNKDQITGLYYITWTPSAHTYTINAVDANSSILQEIVSAKCMEGRNYSLIGLPKVVQSGGNYYVLNDNNVSGYTTPTYTMGSEDETKSITYSEDPTIIYFREVENLNNYTSKTQGNFSGEYHAAISAGKGGELTTFEPGNYQVEGYIVSNSNRGLYLRSNTSNISENIITSIGNLSGQQTSNFSLASSTTLYLTGYTTGTNQVNQSANIDYIIIRRTNVTPTIGADGYATYSSPYPLDFEHATDVRGYYATTASEGTVLMTRVSGTAAANEGLFLQKTGETPTIPILASGSTLTGNLLKPTTGSNIYDTSDPKIQYVFAKQNSELGFYKVVDDLSPTAGKAYLEVTSAIAASRLRFIFEDDEETTGIESRECKSADRNFYNLSGQRILQPRQGLYIVGGKKVIIK